jgi:hypothetical protein
MGDKKKKLSVLSDRDEEALSKLSKKERALAVTGKPDETDVRNLKELLKLYEQSYPGRLKRMKADYDLQNGLGEKVKTPAVKGVQSTELKMLFWLPRDLQEFIEPFYPTLWTNKSHAEWFVKTFPMFKA